MKTRFFFALFFLLHSSFFIANAQPIGQYPVNVMTVDELPRDTYAKLRIGVNGGAVYRIADMKSSGDKQVDDFLTRLRWGMTFNADVTWFLSEEWGIGALYSYAKHSGKDDNYSYAPRPDAYPENKSNGSLEDDIVVQFIGPTFRYRHTTNWRGDSFVAHVAPGYVDYKDDYHSPPVFRGNPAPYTPTDGGSEKSSTGTFGVHLGIGYDFALGETWALGVQLSGLIATRSSEKIIDANGQTNTIDLNKTDRVDNLARVELTVGLRFNK
jgi:hypothetical protein